ncbi:Uncharacterized protein APZ42_011106 [Daphnia magna]|uniref:Uncharacterized protein n=1 Tax=Daphnia magna TaxID=35525 RepID=A0A162T6T1_9CRUS|nr:Uncharacterized protein APZ42_011106 [Daphnia magna]
MLPMIYISFLQKVLRDSFSLLLRFGGDYVKEHFLLQEGCGAIYTLEKQFNSAFRTYICVFCIQQASDYGRRTFK